MEYAEPKVEMERHRDVIGVGNKGIRIPQLNIRGLKPQRNELISSTAAKNIDRTPTGKIDPPLQ